MDAVAVSSSSSSDAPLRPHLVVCSNEQAHYAQRGIDLAVGLSSATALPAVVAPLDCGDYALVWAASAADVSSDRARCYVLIERKTVPDLEASIVDGRYKSQAARLVLSQAPYIFWIVTPGVLFHSDAIDRVRSALLHLQISYPRTRVVQLDSSDAAAFAGALKRISEYVRDAEFEGNSRADVPSLRAAQASGAKARLESQPEVFLEQLCVPRGMSMRKAKAVAAAAPDMQSLLELWRAERDATMARQSAAATAQSASSTSKKRKGGEGGSRKRLKTLEQQVDERLANVDTGKGQRLGPALSARLRETIAPDLTRL